MQGDEATRNLLKSLHEERLARRQNSQKPEIKPVPISIGSVPDIEFVFSSNDISFDLTSFDSPSPPKRKTQSFLENDYLLAQRLQQETEQEFKKQEQDDEMLALALQHVESPSKPVLKFKQLDEDSSLAFILQEQENETQSAQIKATAPFIHPNEKILDANKLADFYCANGEVFPNLHELFVQYDQTYFRSSLGFAEVKWSEKMTLCAGVCCFKKAGVNFELVIKLSQPLLQFRPRSDLINTLLHEMIHGYLCVTQVELDRDAHGPKFIEEMNRINSIANTQISVYHSFFDEVDYYRNHWWKCDRCANVVKRSMNRAPGPHDRWWKSHEQSCGGAYVKIKEPEGYSKSKKKSSKPDPPKKIEPPSNSISKYFPPVKPETPNSGAVENVKPKLPSLTKRQLDGKK